MIDLGDANIRSQIVRVAAVIPSYRVTRHVLDVVKAVPPLVDHIYVVDDACPDGSGRLVKEECVDSRVEVIFHAVNQGVGGAVVTGYRAAIEAGYDIIVKIDGDGQMDPTLARHFVMPIAMGVADYTKGNRFFALETVEGMPVVRLVGNAALSFLSKLSTGYWRIFDPTNGYTAVHREVLRLLPLDKLVGRYFFESEMLFRLGTVGAAVVDVPMRARYENEESSLRVRKVVSEFGAKHVRNIVKRLIYNYFLRDFSVATLEMLAGIFLIFFGLIYGLTAAVKSASLGIETPAGTIAVATVSLILGMQMILAFLAFDIARSPVRALHPILTSAITPRPDPARTPAAQSGRANPATERALV